MCPVGAVRLNIGEPGGEEGGGVGWGGVGGGVLKPVDLVGYRLALSAWAGEFLSRYA